MRSTYCALERRRLHKRVALNKHAVVMIPLITFRLVANNESAVGQYTRRRRNQRQLKSPSGAADTFHVNASHYKTVPAVSRLHHQKMAPPFISQRDKPTTTPELEGRDVFTTVIKFRIGSRAKRPQGHARDAAEVVT
ncbi:hypothetical protein EVAR_94153_1 [Eumeta japonica]|uniref:Uncharacterized protein n=1 Tax=Eumeta variegata TaxID=151549 RepID=A0A4C1U6U2_EUMVA|nr:hypothetical protein EVAR_94153_1 [Eumeta japonica]